MFTNDTANLAAYIAPSPTDRTGGNGLFARTAFAAGEEIFTLPRPAVAAIDTPQLGQTCSNCFHWAAQSVIGDRGAAGGGGGEARGVKRCAGCSTVAYCSRKCQSAHWKREHRRECALFKGLAGKGVLPHVGRAVLEIVGDPAVVEGREGRAALERLHNHMDDFVKAHEMEGAEDDRLGEIQMLAQGLHEFTRKKVELKFIELMCATTLTNSITLYTPTYDPIGLALDPFFASANHSCDPNAIVVFDGPKVSFRTLRPVPQDSEIFIAYVDVNDPKEKRQKDLAHRFFFECKCPKCERGDDKIALDNFIPTSKDPKDIKAEQQRLIRELPITAANSLQTSLATSDPVDAIEAALAGIDLLTKDAHCFSESVYPLHNLRQHLFVSLLTRSTRNCFRVAFVHGMKLYLEAQPLLYVEQFHPVRLVHTWTMVNLARFLSAPDAADGLPSDPKWEGLMPSEIKKADDILDGTTPEEKENPINLAAVGAAMSSEVAFNVGKSHGEKSSLAAAVKRMSEEIEYALHQLREAVKSMSAEDAAKNLTVEGIVGELDRLTKRMETKTGDVVGPSGGRWYR